MLIGWNYRKKLTIDSTKIDSALSDFPVLVKLDNTNFDFSKAKSDGTDIRFTSDNGTTLLKYERERHDSIGEKAEYWVKVPSVTSGSDTDIYIYYGNSGASDGEDATNVWDANFNFVCHMEDLTSSIVKDSTSNENNGTKRAINQPIETDTQIAKGQEFDGSNDYINFGDLSDFEPATFTLEMWGKTVDFTKSANGGIAKGLIFGNASAYSYQLVFGSSVVVAGVTNTSNVGYSVTGSSIDNEAHKWTLVFDGTDVILYKDDTEIDRTAFSGTIDYSKTNNSFVFGGRLSSLYSLNGWMDEVRLSVSDRGVDWIKASYNSENNTLLTFGIEVETNVSETEIVYLSDIIDIDHNITKVYSDIFKVTDDITIQKLKDISDAESFILGEDLVIDHNITKNYFDEVGISDDVKITLDQPEQDGINLTDDIRANYALSLPVSDEFNLADEIIVTKLETINIEESLYIGETYTVLGNEEFSAIESFILSETSDIYLIAPVHYASKVISYNPLVIVTDTDPIQIVKLDVSDPVNPTWQSYFIDAIGETAKNAKDVIFNETFNLLYIVCADGQVVQVDVSDYDIREQIDTGDTDDLLKLAQIDEAHRIFMGTEDTDGEIIVLDEFELQTLQMDLRFLEKVIDTVQTTVNLTHAGIINTDIRMIAQIISTISTDLRFSFVDVGGGVPSNDPYNEVAIYPIARTDFTVYINNVLMSDVQLHSIRIRHTIDVDSEASFVLARKHDQLDYTLEGVSSQITNQNSIKIYIKGHLEFNGKVAQVECNSEEEQVTLTATATEKVSNIGTITLPMSTLNSKLHPYDILLHSPSIYNPYIDITDEDVLDNPPFYKGIKVDLGVSTMQRILRYRTPTDSPVGNTLGFGYHSEGLYSAYPNLKEYIGRNTGFGTSIGKTAFEITNGTFKPRQNWTYFWGPIISNNYIADLESSANYVGTSMAVYSMDTWDLLQVRYRYQRILDDIEETRLTLDDVGSGQIVYVETTPTTDEGNPISDLPVTYRTEYRIGEEPFKEISVRSGIFIPTYRWEDRDNGLYNVLDEGYDYRIYSKTVADLEYEKLKRTHGDVFPETTADVELMLDGYYYYNPTLLSRINISNTTTVNIYNRQNGFPTSVKAIEISADNMRVRLITDNSLALSELQTLDDLYPDIEKYQTPATEKLILVKYDPNRRSEVT